MIPQRKLEDQAVYDALNKFNLNLPAGVTANEIYLTLLAMYILKTEYSDRQQELSLIWRKATAWLRSIGIAEPDAVVRLFTQIKIKFPPCREITIEEARADCR